MTRAQGKHMEFGLNQSVATLSAVTTMDRNAKEYATYPALLIYSKVSWRPWKCYILKYSSTHQSELYSELSASFLFLSIRDIQKTNTHLHTFRCFSINRWWGINQFWWYLYFQRAVCFERAQPMGDDDKPFACSEPGCGNVSISPVFSGHCLYGAVIQPQFSNVTTE